MLFDVFLGQSLIISSPVKAKKISTSTAIPNIYISEKKYKIVIPMLFFTKQLPQEITVIAKNKQTKKTCMTFTLCKSVQPHPDDVTFISEVVTFHWHLSLGLTVMLCPLTLLSWRKTFFQICLQNFLAVLGGQVGKNCVPFFFASGPYLRQLCTRDSS